MSMRNIPTPPPPGTEDDEEILILTATPNDFRLEEDSSTLTPTTPYSVRDDDFLMRSPTPPPPGTEDDLFRTSFTPSSSLSQRNSPPQEIKHKCSCLKQSKSLVDASTNTETKIFMDASCNTESGRTEGTKSSGSSMNREKIPEENEVAGETTGIRVNLSTQSAYTAEVRESSCFASSPSAEKDGSATEAGTVVVKPIWWSNMRTKLESLFFQASLSSTKDERLQYLTKIRERICCHSDFPVLFINETLDLVIDPVPETRVLGLEMLNIMCKVNPLVLGKVLKVLSLPLLQEENVTVKKKAVHLTGNLYKYTLMWISNATFVTDEMTAAWNEACTLKKFIIAMVDSDYDAIRIFCIKFMETIVLFQTSCEPHSTIKPNDFLLDDIPLDNSLLTRVDLETEARLIFQNILMFLKVKHATSVNLMTCIGSLFVISKMRPSLTREALSAIRALNDGYPPTLANSQIRSVKKFIRCQVLSFSTHEQSYKLKGELSALLLEMGGNDNELFSMGKGHDWCLNIKYRPLDKIQTIKPSSNVEGAQQTDDGSCSVEMTPETEAATSRHTEGTCQAEEETSSKVEGTPQRTKISFTLKKTPSKLKSVIRLKRTPPKLTTIVRKESISHNIKTSRNLKTKKDDVSCDTASIPRSIKTSYNLKRVPTNEAISNLKRAKTKTDEPGPSKGSSSTSTVTVTTEASRQEESSVNSTVFVSEFEDDNDDCVVLMVDGDELNSLMP